jgi:hypothetical protein
MALMTGCVFVLGMLSGAAGAAQPDPAAHVLADMRTAIGADAIATLQAFSIRSHRARAVRRSRSGKTAGRWTCALPDRCIEVHSYVSFLASSTRIRRIQRRPPGVVRASSLPQTGGAAAAV